MDNKDMEDLNHSLINSVIIMFIAFIAFAVVSIEGSLRELSIRVDGIEHQVIELEQRVVDHNGGK